jgi:hypothetical protein
MGADLDQPNDTGPVQAFRWENFPTYRLLNRFGLQTSKDPSIQTLTRNSGSGIKFLLLRLNSHPRALVMSFTKVKGEVGGRVRLHNYKIPGCWRRLCECWWGGTEGFQSLLGSQPAAACGWSPSVSDHSRPALYFCLHFAKKTVSASIKGDHKTKTKKYKDPMCTRPKSVQHTRTDMRKYSFAVWSGALESAATLCQTGSRQGGI